MEKLSSTDLVNLVHAVFPKFPEDRFLGILVDIPHTEAEDRPEWKTRRALVEEWALLLKQGLKELGLDGIRVLVYPDVGSNNADLPEFAYLIRRPPIPRESYEMEIYGLKVAFAEIFRKIQVFLAPTQFSATAPLKNAAQQYNFRAATMPGFSPQMISTLKIDYQEVNRRVGLLKEKLDKANAAAVVFQIENEANTAASDSLPMFFDLRFRQAHASTGRFPQKGTAGNLPSGEAYIVPYEGEKDEPSQTEGTLPVQIGEDIVLFSIKANRAVEVRGTGTGAEKERERLNREPAYGNMAELGFGVLGDFGIQATGEILLDEKLGFHVAFGRSEHFGGITGPEDFSSPEEVIHLDRIYIPATQPRIKVQSIVLQFIDSPEEKIFEDGKYLIF